MTPEEKRLHVRELERARYRANREHILARKAARRRINPVGTLSRERAWREKNRDRINQQKMARRAQSKGYWRALHFKKAYGLSLDEVAQMFETQGGKCGVCGVEMQLIERPGHGAHVDHDHITGRVRGLLCRRCNVGLGHLGDSIDGLKAAIAYLERSA